MSLSYFTSASKVGSFVYFLLCRGVFWVHSPHTRTSFTFRYNVVPSTKKETHERLFFIKVSRAATQRHGLAQLGCFDDYGLLSVFILKLKARWITDMSILSKDELNYKFLVKLLSLALYCMKSN